MIDAVWMIPVFFCGMIFAAITIRFELHLKGKL